MRFVSRLKRGLASTTFADFALAFAACPFCGPSLFVRLNASESGIRCIRCAASTNHLSIGLAFRGFAPDPASLDTCELSARGPYVDYLRRVSRGFSGSEYDENVEPGRLRDGIRCEDVQRLTYADAAFDVVTHTEVLEHVPDDARAFAQLHRVLRPGGLMLFTVPLSGLAHTIERARLRDGQVQHLLEPVYHSDPQRPGSGILAFRDYGFDVIDRIEAAGFVDCAIVSPLHRIPWLRAHEVIVARRPND